jgi:murein DD-endopeptidase MepM/ murein hydrolase activator NlpD
MASPRYTILISNRETGSVRRLTIARRPALALVFGVMVVPILIGAGTLWSTKAEIQALQTSAESLQLENDSYRAVTGELATQIASLQSAMVDIGQQAQLDPAAKLAMDNLPALVRARAMGGTPSVAPSPSSTVQAASDAPGGTFGILHNLLGVLGSQLESVKAGVERQQALAVATPSMWPVVGWLSSTFGSRSDPFTGAPEYHPGLDISADYGAPVRATADGTIDSAGWSGNYGNAVVIKHGFGISTRYGHLSRVAVRNGQEVHRGDLIGYVGATGRATSSHLHYEILLNGRPVDPLRMLTK